MKLGETHLERAVQDGIISAEQADRLRQLAARADREEGSRERFRIVNNFAEIFVSIGQIMLAVGITSSFALAPPKFWQFMAAAAAVFSIVMAEFFYSRARMLWPSIVACIMTTFFATITISLLFGFQPGVYRNLWDYGGDIRTPLTAFVTLGVLLFRYRLPFLALPLAVLGLVLAHTVFRIDTQSLMAIVGIACLSIAVWLDLGDPERVLRRSDFAFWLYVAGAPMLLHPVYYQLVWSNAVTGGSTLLVALIASIATLFGLALDRRSPIVASLTYVGIVITWSIGRVATSTSGAVTLTLLVLGVAVILLGVLWRPARRLLLAPFEGSSFAKMLPPVREGT